MEDNPPHPAGKLWAKLYAELTSANNDAGSGPGGDDRVLIARCPRLPYELVEKPRPRFTWLYVPYDHGTHAEIHGRPPPHEPFGERHDAGCDASERHVAAS